MKKREADGKRGKRREIGWKKRGKGRKSENMSKKREIGGKNKEKR